MTPSLTACLSTFEIRNCFADSAGWVNGGIAADFTPDLSGHAVTRRRRYERTAALYHHARGTPPKRLFWAAVPGGRWRIDWPRTNQAFR